MASRYIKIRKKIILLKIPAENFPHEMWIALYQVPKQFVILINFRKIYVPAVHFVQ